MSRCRGVLFMAASLALSAQDPITVNPNRPSFSTPSLTTQEGVAEVEWGVQHSKLPEGLWSQGTPALLKLGLVPDFELRISSNGYLRQQVPGQELSTGLGDLSLATQWCYTHHGLFGMDQAVQLSHKFPVAAQGLGSGQADDTLALFSSRDLPGDNHIDVNFLQNWLGKPEADGGGRETQLAASLSMSHGLSESLSLGGEVYWLAPTRAGGTVSSTLWCLAYKVSKRLVLDAGVDLGLSHDAPRATFFAGLTYGLGRFRRVQPEPAH